MLTVSDASKAFGALHKGLFTSHQVSADVKRKAYERSSCPRAESVHAMCRV